jgi:hypothetical protein
MTLILVHSGPHNGRKKFCKALAEAMASRYSDVRVSDEFLQLSSDAACIVYGLNVFYQPEYTSRMAVGIVMEWHGESVLMHQLHKVGQLQCDVKTIQHVIQTHEKHSSHSRKKSTRNHCKTISFTPVLHDSEIQMQQFKKISAAVLAMC